MAKSKKKKEEQGVALPQGLSARLTKSPVAMQAFSGLNENRQQALVQYVQSAQSGADAKQRIVNAVEQLEDGNASFF